MDFKNKKLIVFDLDGTLTESKAPLTSDVSELLVKLLEKKPVAVISGGRYQQFQEQFLKHLSCPPELLSRLYLFPTTATAFYRYNADPASPAREQGGWQKVYEHLLPAETRKKVIDAFEEVFKELGYQHPEKTYGPVLQDRGTQITFTAVGQDIVDMIGAEKGVAAKLAFKETGWREKIAAAMQKRFPDLEAKVGGYSSVDVVQKGIDKGYGVMQIEKHIGVSIKDMLFIGDQIVPGGNDYAVVKTGVDYIQVPGPKQAKEAIEQLL
jgi:phosphomannomutase